MVCQHLAGATWLDRPAALLQSGGRLAELHARVHQLDGSGLISQRERMRWQIQVAPLLSPLTRRAALRVLEELPGGDRLCHGDFHPGNVMVDGDREVIIDWHDASSGNPAGDVARTWLLLRTAHWSYPGTRRAAVRLAASWLFRRYLKRYQALVPGMGERLRRWRLPVVAARLSEELAEVEGPLLRLAADLARLEG